MILQALINGLVSSGLYALVALAFVVIFKTSGVINFSQGYVMTFIMFLAFSFFSLNLPYTVVFLIVCVISILFSLVIFGVVEQVSKFEAELNPLIATLAVGIIVLGFAGVIWGPNSRSIPPLVEGTFRSQIVSFQWNEFSAIIVSIITITILLLFFYKTRYGIAMRAANDQHQATLLMGIPMARIKALSWVISGLLCAISGFMLAPMVFVDQSGILNFVILSFAAATIGSLGSFLGAIVGGLILGISTNLFAVYVSSDFKTTFAFLLLLIVLAIKPSGLFGSSDITKV